VDAVRTTCLARRTLRAKVLVNVVDRRGEFAE
jgi:hypothetical protein